MSSLEKITEGVTYCAADVEWSGEWRWRFELADDGRENYLLVGFRGKEVVEFGLLIPATEIEGKRITITEEELESGKYDHYRTIGEGAILS